MAFTVESSRKGFGAAAPLLLLVEFLSSRRANGMDDCLSCFAMEVVGVDTTKVDCLSCFVMEVGRNSKIN